MTHLCYGCSLFPNFSTACYAKWDVLFDLRGEIPLLFVFLLSHQIPINRTLCRELPLPKLSGAPQFQAYRLTAYPQYPRIPIPRARCSQEHHRGGVPRRLRQAKARFGREVHR